MSNTLNHAKRELSILSKSNDDPNNRPIIEEFIPEILALVEKFGNSGQSGGSAPYTASALASAVKALCLFEPICDITGHEEEWTNVSDIGDGRILYQNNRLSSIFKDEENGDAYYLDAIVWKTENSSWTGSAILADNVGYYEKISSRQYINSFPFKPKTFYIDVIEKEVAPNDWEFYIKDENQLIEVFNYYKKY